MEARRIVALAKHLTSPALTSGIATVNGRAELSVSAGASLCGVNEQATFVVRLSNAPPNGPAGRALPHTVKYRLSQDGVEPITEGTALLDREGSASISGSLPHPGFLQCEVSWQHANGVVLTATAASGFDPTAIPAVLPPPKDFDEFWEAQKAELAAVEINSVFTPVAAPPWVPGVDCFDVQAECAGGAPVSGYLARPTTASPGSLPALLIVHGAGVRSADLSPNGSFHGDEPYPDFWRSGTHGVEPNHNSTTEWAAEGVLTLNLNAHGVENGREAAYYEMLGASGKYDVLLGRESKETSYLRGMYLRLIRAIDVLAEQREWDGRTLAVLGML
jgi:cephalosporin-C deacetylase